MQPPVWEIHESLPPHRLRSSARRQVGRVEDLALSRYLHGIEVGETS